MGAYDLLGWLNDQIETGKLGGTTKVVPLGSVSGAVTCDLSQGLCFTGTVTGDVTVSFTNWPSGSILTEPLLILTNDATGGHAISLTGVVWEPAGVSPTFDTAASHINLIPVSSPDQGGHIYGVTGGAVSKATVLATGITAADLPSAAPAFVRAGGNANSGTSTNAVTALSAAVPAAGHAAGNTVFVAVGGGGGTVAVPSLISDSKGNTYTIDNSLVVANSGSPTLAHSKLTTPLVSGDTITVTWAAATTLAVMDTAEFSGIRSAASLDAIASNNGAASTSLDAGTTSALGQALELGIGVFFLVSTSGGSSAGTGWTKLNDLSVGDSSHRALIWEYQQLSTTAAADATATISTAHSYYGLTTTFKSA